MIEVLDVVNDKDEVIGSAPYSEIYAAKFPHRICHLFIFNDAGEMALQLRSKIKSFCPGLWSTAAGGHVQSGETYEIAIMRESMEEIGVAPLAKFLAVDRYNDPSFGHFKFLGSFTSTYNGEFEINLKEVEKISFFPLKEIQEMINQKEKFHPELLFLLEKYFGIKK